jgi:hypothetical protein
MKNALAETIAAGQLSDLKTYIPPPNRTLQGTSSWLNYYLQRDSRPGRPRTDRIPQPPSPVTDHRPLITDHQ